MYLMVLYGILVLISYFIVNKSNENSKTQKYLVLFVITILVFRFSLGSDTDVYMIFFERVSDPIKDSFIYVGQRNIGFNMLLYYTKALIYDYRFFVFIFNVIVISLCFYVIYKHSQNFVLSLMLFVGSGILEIYYASALRQMLAMAIFFYAFFQFLPRKKYKLYYLFALLACLFHETALITLFIPVVMILQDKIEKHEKRILVILVLMAGLFMISFTPFLVYIGKNFSSYSTINHIVAYFYGTTFSIMGVGLRVSIFGIIYLLYNASEISRKNKWLQTQVYVCFFSMLFYLAFSNFSVFSRISDFIDIISLITFANLLKNVEDKNSRLVFLTAIVAVNFITLYADIDFKLDHITGIENAKFSDYTYMSIFSNDAYEYILDHYPEIN
ncbi:MAG: EpsG family protein [Erysipelotrichaceae bacterium]